MCWHNKISFHSKKVCITNNLLFNKIYYQHFHLSKPLSWSIHIVTANCGNFPFVSSRHIWFSISRPYWQIGPAPQINHSLDRSFNISRKNGKVQLSVLFVLGYKRSYLMLESIPVVYVQASWLHSLSLITALILLLLMVLRQLTLK